MSVSTLSSPKTIENLAPRDIKRAPNPLKICVLAACPFPANHGTPGSIREMVEVLAARGHEVHLITYPHGEDIPVKGVVVHRVAALFGQQKVVVGPTKQKPFYDFLMVLKTIQICWRHRIEIVHAHLYEAAIAAWMSRFFTFRKFVYSAHNTMRDELASYGFFRSKRFANMLAGFLDWFVPARANRCIPHSFNIREFLNQRGLQNRCSNVINFGIDVNDVVDRQRVVEKTSLVPQGYPVIAYTGILDNFQRLDLLLEAMAIVARHNSEAQLVIGMTLEQPEFVEKLRQTAVQLEIQDQVHFTPRLSFDQCLAVLNEADIAVSPRPKTPGFPIKLLNYWALQKPVVMFESSASGIEHGEEAWLAPEDTAESLAEGIIALADSHELCGRLAERGFQFVSEQHDRARIAERLEQVFEQTLNRQPHSED